MDFLISQESDEGFCLSFLDVAIPRLPKEFHGYRIAQLSDFHLGPATPLSHIQQALAITAQIKPHLVVLTGDYIQHGNIGIRHLLATNVNPRVFQWLDYRRKVRSHAEKLGEALSVLQPEDGIFAVFGNHDYLEGVHTVRRQLGNHIHWLVNSSALLRRGENSLLIAGLDDFRRGSPDLARTLQPESSRLAQQGKLQEHAKGERETAHRQACFRILLSHNPDVTIHPQADLLEGFHLVLSGHTHGGQIRLPLLGAIFTRTAQRKHVQGLSTFGNCRVYVSNGVGYGSIRLRLFCPPEICIVTLRQK